MPCIIKYMLTPLYVQMYFDMLNNICQYTVCLLCKPSVCEAMMVNM